MNVGISESLLLKKIEFFTIDTVLLHGRTVFCYGGES